MLQRGRALCRAVLASGAALVVLASMACGADDVAAAGGSAAGADTGASAADAGAPFDGAFDASFDGAGLACGDAGTLATMSADPDAGAVDVASYCLTLINGYRAKQGLAPYWLQDTSASAMCCAVAEAERAAIAQGHVNGGCGWKSQGFCGGARNPDGTVKASMDWCPKLFYQEGPTGGHYQAMMRPEPRGIMCSFYALSRDKHAIVVDYY